MYDSFHVELYYIVLFYFSKANCNARTYVSYTIILYNTRVSHKNIFLNIFR